MLPSPLPPAPSNVVKDKCPDLGDGEMVNSQHCLGGGGGLAVTLPTIVSSVPTFMSPTVGHGSLGNCVYSR